ncbi:foldase protein PrsA [Candidatus Fervidibacteria bacterium JGI MDM2 SSWTFF-3-K9]
MSARCWFLTVIVFALTGCRPAERVIAKADGVTITAKELQEELWRRYGAVALKELIQRKLLEREARERGIKVTDSEVAQILKRQGLPNNPENWHRVRTELILDKLANSLVEVTEAEARRYYEQNRALYEQPERVRLRDITLESKENAEAIWKALQLRKGDNFAELARHFSINPVTRQRGGDMGVIPVSDLHPKLREIVKRMKVGDFSKPIEIDGEWVIVKLEARLPAERKTFEKVRDQVIVHLKQQKVWQMKLELPNKLLRGAKITVFDPHLKVNLQ